MPQNAVRAVAPAAGARRLSVKFINPMVGRYDIFVLCCGRGITERYFSLFFRQLTTRHRTLSNLLNFLLTIDSSVVKGGPSESVAPQMYDVSSLIAGTKKIW